MSEKILVLEPSTTTQSIITSALKKSAYESTFETNGLKLLISMYNTLPSVVLINAKCMNPKSSELVRLIKSVDRLRKIPVGVYAVGDFSFEQHYMRNSGADLFIHFESESLVGNIETLLDLARKNKLSAPMESDIMKSGIAEQVFALMPNLPDIEELCHRFLCLLTEFCEVPAVSILLNDEDGAYGYYICSSNFTETEKADFIKVCATDFDEIIPYTNIRMVNPKCLEPDFDLSKYHTSTIPLSAFQREVLMDSKKKKVGTVNAVREGTFTSHQIDLLDFCIELFNPLVENALYLKRKLKFEKNIRKAFSRFVPSQIIDELVKDADQSAKVSVGEKRDVAILFSDIRSFTTISEQNKPETIVAFLNRYFTVMCTIIKKHGGTIDKFIGDAIMALFGAPVSYEDNARRAVAAAYEMREALKTVELEDLVMPEGMKFNIGIGIHYGDVIVGSIGSNDKTDYSVIGDNVNLASRMEGLTKTYGTMILVTDAVRNDLYKTNGDTCGFEFRYLDDVKVKGKEKAVPIYAIDSSPDEFPREYRDAYSKGFDLYKQGIWNLAREYFEKALALVPEDKAAKLMLDRCVEFIKNPPENWDGAITFHTK
ncbi:MAG: guanylate cyclase [Treponema sp.]|nr:guanylate cyclase [Treponema sp.]